MIFGNPLFGAKGRVEFVGLTVTYNPDPFVVDTPAEVQQGDFLLAIVFSSADVGITGTGWSVVFEDRGPLSLTILSKKADGVELTHSFVGASTKHVIVMAYRNGQEINAGPSFQYISSTTVTAASITPTKRGVLLFYSGISNGGESVITPPAGMEEIYTETVNKSAPGRFTLYGLALSEPGSTGSKSVTWSGTGTMVAALLQIS